MAVNVQLERLYDRIELGRGAGQVRSGTLCIMSFVAYLAGERHIDRPKTASPLIRAFAIQLNDGAVDRWRQELKPFAPKIIGTNDGREQQRADILFRAVVDEILPRARAEFGSESRPSHRSSTLEFATPYGPGALVDPREAYAVLALNIRPAHTKMSYLTMATLAGNILPILSRCSQTVASKRWFWCKALEILDRLCDVGAEDRVPAISSLRAEQLREQLDKPLGSQAGTQNFVKHPPKAMGVIPRLYKAVLHHVA
jgi:hypothetical protein